MAHSISRNNLTIMHVRHPLIPKQCYLIQPLWPQSAFNYLLPANLTRVYTVSNRTLKLLSVPRCKGHAFVLLAVVQKKIAITVTHTRLPLRNPQASVQHWKNLSGACLWQTVRAAVYEWLMWAVVVQRLWQEQTGTLQ